MTLADDCSTHVEIYQRAFDPVIYADSHRAAPAELLDALDALGLDRCGAPPPGFWHQAPAGLDKRTQRQIVSRAAAALCSAGWVVNIDPRLLDKDAYDTAIQEAARVTRATGTSSPATSLGTTPRFRTIGYPAQDRFAVLLTRHVADMVDELTGTLERADPDDVALLLATAVAPDSGLLARLGTLLAHAATYLSAQGNPAEGHRFELAAEALDDQIRNLHRPADPRPPTTRAPLPPPPPGPRPGTGRTGP